MSITETQGMLHSV